ncbi:Epoxyqueuosine reductase [Trichinella pseudospiralis]
MCTACRSSLARRNVDFDFTQCGHRPVTLSRISSTLNSRSKALRYRFVSVIKQRWNQYRNRFLAVKAFLLCIQCTGRDLSSQCFIARGFEALYIRPGFIMWLATLQQKSKIILSFLVLNPKI